MNLSQVTKEILKKRTYGSDYKTDMADENSFLYFNFLSFLVEANFLKLQILAVTSGSYLNKLFWVFREKDKLLNVQYTQFYQGIKILAAVFYNEILLSQLLQNSTVHYDKQFTRNIITQIVSDIYALGTYYFVSIITTTTTLNSFSQQIISTY